MTRDIIGDWEVSQVDRTKKTVIGRIAFAERDGRIVVVDADPESGGTAARVDIDGTTIRFEMLSGGSSRGHAHYSYEISLHGPYAFGGTRRRGLLAKTPITGERVGELAEPAPAAAWAPPVAAPGYAAELSSDFSGMPNSLAEAKARAAEAAERAALAAAEAEAAQAEVEAAAALENARRAAERAAAARAAVSVAAQAPAEHPAPQPVTEEALATLPAPTEPPAIVPESTPMATVAYAAAAMRVTHRLSGGGSSILAVEVFPDVFVWGESYATTQRLRGIGWSAAPIESDERIEVAARLLQQATQLRDSLAS